ncbi:MAG: ATP-binding cassette domain-containing protein [Planctomycetota bacterium]
MSYAIDIQGLTKSFGSKVAVDGLNLQLPTGKLYGYIGPNGAGKTTTIRMILSILFPDAGKLSVLGKPSAVESKDRIGYLPEERGVYRKMKVAGFLDHMGKLKGMGGPDLTKTISDWLERVALADVAQKKCEELSKGMQQKVQFIATVMHDPELLILDEPFSGLDPVNMRLLRELIREQHAMGKTVIFSTHVMFQAEQLCDHVVMINSGKKVLDDDLAAIRARHVPTEVAFETLDGDEPAPLRQLSQISAVEKSETGWEASIAEGVNPSEALRAVVGAMPVSRIELKRPTLEDVFIEKVLSEGSANIDTEALRASLRSGATAAEGVDAEPIEEGAAS